MKGNLSYNANLSKENPSKLKKFVINEIFY